jgi:hypothetical protein
MRSIIKLSLLVGISALSAYACSSSSNSNFGSGNEDGGAGNDGSGPLGDGGFGSDVGNFGDGNISDAGGGSTTIYAHTDTELYSFDPATQNVTLIGPFQGFSDAAADNAITDLAVTANNEIWVNSETVIYTAQLPASGTGPVVLTKKAKIATVSKDGGSQKFFALAFAPVGALDPNNEVLVAGDNTGELYTIDQSTGALKALGDFGSTYQLSGDMVFYSDQGTFKGLATIRTCGSPNCKDFLAAVDMNALKTAYTSGTASAAILDKVYGTGTGFSDLFGVGAWGDKVYAFSRNTNTDAGQQPAQLVSIDSTGVGTSLKSFASITKGFSGAGVTTKAAITIPPPK